jgi:transcriptional accessory protein Tex/SPT6
VADTEEALADYSEYINSLFANDVAAIDAVQTRQDEHDANGEEVGAVGPGGKRRGRAEMYSYFTQKGVAAFLSSYCVPVAQFAQGVDDGQLNEPPVMTEEPEVVAEMAMVSKPFDDGTRLLSAARKAYAIEAAAHPSLRAKIRSDVQIYACITVRPTQLGYQSIEPWDRLAGYRFITNKPIVTLKDDDWLWLLHGRRSHLLEVKVHVPEDDVNNIKRRMLRVLEPDETNEVTLAWHREHSAMIDLLMDRLLHGLLREIEEQLTGEAELYVLEQCANYVRNLVSRSPYRPHHAISKDREPGLRVASVVIGDRSQPSSIAMVDGSGNIMDTLELGYLMVRPHSRNLADLEHRREDHNKLLALLLKYRPDVIALGAESMDCRSTSSV